ncbi:rhodanese-like domain-containing protein [Streptomyces fagopyri]|uniref:rhodanese-like domain-containing protein n=1 Tax=Streptomyces fagopyri TaxID=2662397 RepID=UPI0037126E7D
MFLFRRSAPRPSVDQARTRGDRPEAVLLNVREKPGWKAVHAPGAVHAPVTGRGAGTALPASAQGRPLVVMRPGGHRSQRAARLLTGRGVDAVDVKGGMNAWATAGCAVIDARGNSGTTA